MSSRSGQDRVRWEELYASGARPDRPPSAWMVETVTSLPNELPVVDIAGGTGRHGIPVARAGYRVVLVDIASNALTSARQKEPSISVLVGDATKLPLKPRAFGIVMVANFLDRAIFPDLQALIAPGGYLVYETYTVDHLELMERGLARGPQSWNYRLEHGELRRLAAPMTIIYYWEGEVEDAAGLRRCARLLAQSA
jgi:tellurite methyltransferase